VPKCLFYRRNVYVDFPRSCQGTCKDLHGSKCRNSICPLDILDISATFQLSSPSPPLPLPYPFLSVFRSYVHFMDSNRLQSDWSASRALVAVALKGFWSSPEGWSVRSRIAAVKEIILLPTFSPTMPRREHYRIWSSSLFYAIFRIAA
jgi:hypothetical protein